MRPRARWYVITFHYQMAILSWTMLVSFVVLPFHLRWGVVPFWIWPPLLVIAFPFLGYAATRTTFPAMWLQGIGGSPKPVIAAPSRINCLVVGCQSFVFMLLAAEFVEGARAHPFLALFLAFAAVFALLGSVCGYSWQRDEVGRRP